MKNKQYNIKFLYLLFFCFAKKKAIGKLINKQIIVVWKEKNNEFIRIFILSILNKNKKLVIEKLPLLSWKA